MTDPKKSVQPVKLSEHHVMDGGKLDEAHQRLMEATPKETVVAPENTITRVTIRRDGNGIDVRSLITHPDGRVGRQTVTCRDSAHLREKIATALASGTYSAVNVAKGELYTNAQGESMTTDPMYWLGVHDQQVINIRSEAEELDTVPFPASPPADAPADDKADSSDAS